MSLSSSKSLNELLSMSETTAPVNPPVVVVPPAPAKTPPVPPIPSRASLVKHLASCKEETLQLVGTTLLNPYMYVKRNITPLEAELLAAETVTQDLADRIFKVKAAVLPEKK